MAQVTFKVIKKEKTRKLYSFRLVPSVVEAVQKIAEAEKVSVTAVVQQMLEHCVADYEKTKRNSGR